MADELTFQVGIRVNNGARVAFGGRSIRVDQAGIGFGVPGTISVLTSGTTVDLSALTTEGLIYIENLDDTNFVEYGGTTDKPFRINPGEAHAMRMNPGETLHMAADTATVQMFIACQED